MHIGMDIDLCGQDVAMGAAEKVNDNLDAMAHPQDHGTSSSNLQKCTQDHMGLANLPSGPRSQLQKQFPQRILTGPYHYPESEMRQGARPTRGEPTRRHTDTSIDTVLQRHPRPAAVTYRIEHPVVPPPIPKKRNRSPPPISKAHAKIRTKATKKMDALVMKDFSVAEIEERKSKAAIKLNTVLARAHALKEQTKPDGRLPEREKRKAQCALKVTSRQEARLRATLADPQGLFPAERKRKSRVQCEKLASDLEDLLL